MGIRPRDKGWTKVKQDVCQGRGPLGHGWSASDAWATTGWWLPVVSAMEMRGWGMCGCFRLTKRVGALATCDVALVADAAH